MKQYATIFLTVLIVPFFVSCKASKKKAGNVEDIEMLSGEYCACFSKLTDKMSADTKKVIMRAADSEDPANALRSEVVRLGDERGKRVVEELQGMGISEDENPDVSKCIDDVDNKYKAGYNLDDRETLYKILAVLENKPDCIITAGVIKMGLKGLGLSGE